MSILHKDEKRIKRNNYSTTAGFTMGCKLKTGNQLNAILTIPKINPIIKPILVSEYGLFKHWHFNIFFIHTASLLKQLSVSSGLVNPINAATVNANKLIPDNTFTKQIIFATSMCVKINYLVHVRIFVKLIRPRFYTSRSNKSIAFCENIASLIS